MLTRGRLAWVAWSALAAAGLAVVLALASGRNDPALGEPLDLESPAPAVTLIPAPSGAPPDPSATTASTPTASRTTAVAPQQPVLVPNDDDDDKGDDDKGDDDKGDDDKGDDDDDD